MKKTYILLTLTLISTFAIAQFKWANRGGSWAYDYGYGVVNDNDGNVYVAGKFEINDATFSDQITVQCQGNHDSFLAKYDKNGSIQWVKTSGGPDGDYSWGVSTDGSSNLYVAGEIEGSSNIIFSGSNIVLNGKGDNDIFIAKYDLNGNLIWAKSEGTIESEKALAVTNDTQGNVYICGYFSDFTNFNGNAITGYGGRDIFIAKYDGNGNFQWSQKAGSTGRDEARSIKCDNNGNLYICGMFSGTSTFGNLSLTSEDAYQDSYVAKLSASDGSFQWVKKGNAVYDDVAWSLVLDNSNNVYAAGEFNSYIKWETSTMGVPTTKNADVYVVKFDASGNVQWIRAGGGNQVDRARGLGTNGQNLFLTGQFGGDNGAIASFGTYTLSGADSSDIFLAAMDFNGTWLWAASVGGPKDTFEPLGYESGIAITANNEGVYATGGMLRDTTHGNNVSADFGGINLMGYTRTDMWVAAIGLNGVGLNEGIINVSDLVNIYPNPTTGNLTADLSALNGESVINVYNMVGQKVFTSVSAERVITMDLSALQEGVYMIEIQNESSVLQNKKFILQH